jgi:hypothetical protein
MSLVDLGNFEWWMACCTGVVDALERAGNPILRTWPVLAVSAGVMTIICVVN